MDDVAAWLLHERVLDHFEDLGHISLAGMKRFSIPTCSSSNFGKSFNRKDSMR